MPPAVTGVPSSEKPTTVLDNRDLRSSKSLLSAIIAMISDAAIMSNPVSLNGPFEDDPTPVTIFRSALSCISVTLRQVILYGSNPDEDF